MPSKKSEKYRNRKHLLLLYPDNESHMKALEIIKSNYDFAYILHDKDVDADGVILKPHIHCIITTGSNAIWNTALAEKLDIELKFIEEVGKLDRALEYLIHYNDSEKYPYDVEEVKGTLKVKLKQSINNDEKSEGEKVVELIKFIKSAEKKVSVTEFSYYCATEGYWDIFRRSGAIFIKMLEEHNKYLEEKEENENN